MVANGLLADAQVIGDLLVGLAAGQQFEDLDLASGQPIVEFFGGGGAREHVHHAVRHGARHHPLSGRDGEDAGHNSGSL